MNVSIKCGGSFNGKHIVLDLIAEPFATALPEGLLQRTLCDVFLATASRFAAMPALQWHDDDRRLDVTWLEYREMVSRVAGGLRKLGLVKGDRLVMLTRTRVEWFVIEMACYFLGVWPITIYHTSSPRQLQFTVRHCVASWAVVEDQKTLQRFMDAAGEAPFPVRYIGLDKRGYQSREVVRVGTLLNAEPVCLEEYAARIQPEDIATVIYTSGTTGDAKGAMISHRAANAQSTAFAWRTGIEVAGSKVLSYLSMAHSGERMASHWMHLVYGTIVTICSDLSRLPQYFQEVRPNWLFGAPRLWEKQRAAIEALLDEDGALRAAFTAARSVGIEVFQYRNTGRKVPAELDLKWETVKRESILPVLARIGYDELKVVVSGSAPMPRELQEWWIGTGMMLSDVYGSTETLTISWNPHQIAIGTSGLPLTGVKIAIDGDGEIQVSSPGLFSGYLDDPARTSEVMTADGWYRTGDVGTLDELGNLRVIDRKKDMVIPSSGHNVSPVNLEAGLKEWSLIAHACVVGDGRPFCAALLVLDPVSLLHWSRSNGLDTDEHSQLSSHPALLRQLQLHLDAVNSRMARSESIGAFWVLVESWLPDTDVLTATGKIRRNSIKARYASQIDEMYRRAMRH